MGFSRQEYWSGLPFPSPGDLPNPGTEPASLVSTALQVDSLPTEPSGKPSQLLSSLYLPWFQLPTQIFPRKTASKGVMYLCCFPLSYLHIKWPRFCTVIMINQWQVSTTPSSQQVWSSHHKGAIYTTWKRVRSSGWSLTFKGQGYFLDFFFLILMWTALRIFAILFSQKEPRAVSA